MSYVKMSQLGPTGLVGYLPSHIQRAQEKLLTRAHGIIVNFIVINEEAHTTC